MINPLRYYLALFVLLSFNLALQAQVKIYSEPEDGFEKCLRN
ncbi:hypothetical protein OU798_03815 [Prolixibacteraceae bacterium Z1-6]|uniref:Uncharacterized protein n=1 Tax=Draconibacterium aestuarii TaxID=2998507 RepID=A0A9X3F461_9BACT|nr:hypothetical protein [Prolixibacteraceae bacterium Z1-6]